MFCKNCGSELKEDTIFCGHCGTPVKEIDAAILEEIDHKQNISETLLKENENMAQQEEVADTALVQDDQGNFSWMYEFSLWKNPTILITTWKIMMIACCAPALVMFFITLFDGEDLDEVLRITLSMFGILAGIITVISAIAYFIFEY